MVVDNAVSSCYVDEFVCYELGGGLIPVLFDCLTLFFVGVWGLDDDVDYEKFLLLSFIFCGVVGFLASISFGFSVGCSVPLF